MRTEEKRGDTVHLHLLVKVTRSKKLFSAYGNFLAWKLPVDVPVAELHKQ